MAGNITYHILEAKNAGELTEADVFDNSVDPVQLAAFVADRGHEMVYAKMGSVVIGMASGTVLLHPDKPPAFFINEVGVDKNMRNQGIGTKLTGELIKLARAKGCKGIWLATETNNRQARALYQKLGARETEAIVVYDWDGALDD